ncbi:beta-N-acetylhexosaminidase [Pseudochelatococcus sp. G4_1912]|uniref:beta-N-acetylhexosaminidase n=1 Tax=Pseudochelatococcus sp. G4_1912 TaxID=3114288 RepID=UPI0039C689F9
MKALILGCSGPRLADAERALFKEADPWGFILFKRNIGTPDEVRSLTASLRDCVGRADVPILIDQEGGRVQRMRAPHWTSYPAGSVYGQLAEQDPLMRRALAWQGARLIAHDLYEVGINVNCAPILDVPVAGANDVIGDRAYHNDPAVVSVLGRAVAEGYLAGSVLPVIKHIPGHGRGNADSHLSLPVVEASAETLVTHDFVPFRALADMPIAMSAHIVFTAFDRERPATVSPVVIENIIRGEIGFDGLLLSDDLSMNALQGSIPMRAKAALAAGCDIALHCNGDFDEMTALIPEVAELSGNALRRANAALQRINHPPEPFDPVEGRTRLETALANLASTINA